MRVNKAKRRLLQWQRYGVKTGSRPNNFRLGGNHRGYVMAFSNVLYAKRYVPIGAREPWVPLWSFGWKGRA